jgi:hypothetical protein
MKYAVIIKHHFRDYDWRVDIVEVSENVSPQDIKRVIESEMLGPFEVVYVTPKLNTDRSITKGLERIARDTESHSET